VSAVSESKTQVIVTNIYAHDLI